MFERSILRSMVEYPNDINIFLSVAKKDFFSKKAREILDNILVLHAKNALSIDALNEITPLSLKEDDYYINFLIAQINPNYKNQTGIFIKNYKLKIQQQIATEIQLACNNKEIVDFSLLNKNIDFYDFTLKTFQEWEEEYNKKPQKPKYKSGVSFLDSCLDGGFELAQMVLISGDPEAGKTMLGLQILENISNAHRVLFFSLEFTIDQYIQRRGSYKHFNKNNIFIENQADDLKQVIEIIKSAYARGIKIFLIDSQMRILSDNSLNMEERETLKFTSIAKLCHKLEILVFFIIQNSKADADNPSGTKKGGHESSITIRIERVKPSKDDLDSVGKEYSENKRLIIVKKNKQTGKHFKEEVKFNPKTQRFSAIEYAKPSEVIDLDLPDI